ncbi:MAG: phytoene/squalene synthase family protein [Aquisalimonadaceae bacterium]
MITNRDTACQDSLLPGVSRTFALTIPQLPSALRPAITNAYLLCRIADTIEDSARMSADEKDHHYTVLVDTLRGEADPAHFSAALLAACDVEDVLERQLLEKTPEVVAVFRTLPPPQQAALRRCVDIMARGMARFERLKRPDGLPDRAAFRDYCYVVAGVVGEMLTSLFAQANPAIARHETTLQPLAVGFGQGLQMTNILKDVWDDRGRGICWLPRDVMREHGCSLDADADWAGDAQFRDGLHFLVGVAHHHLEQARQYTLKIPAQEVGIRRFCSWAVGMALYTLHNIADNRAFTAGDQVKISRSRLRAIITGCNLSVRSDLMLNAGYRWASRGLPVITKTHLGALAAEERTTCME